MARIAIVGAGTAGLHLALRLQAFGVPVTLYTDRSPADMRAGRLPNTVAHNGATRERERALGVNHWDSEGLDIHSIGFSLSGPLSFRFRGQLDQPGLFVDYRLYQPRLAEDFVARGGQLEVAAIDAAGVGRLAQQHDVVVVATGRAGLGNLFPRMPEHSPYSRPARLLFAGLFHGISPVSPLGMQFNFTAGHGEVFEARMATRHGPVGSLLVEATPGGGFADVATRKVDEDPRGFEVMLLAALREHAPATFERIDPAAFRLTGPTDWLQGGFAPVVRRGYAPVGEGRFALAVGDAHVLHDPIAGQGANAASAAAWELAEVIREAVEGGERFDEGFFQRAEARTWASEHATTLWNNAMLEPPPPHMGQLLFAASQDPRLADVTINTLVFPQKALENFAGPESTMAFIARHGQQASSAA
ncbi:MAG TPA: styrene monooxygenase/indole monooxygenase family protein [Nannocystis sp.]|jgi:2-polyprenyl-6-methoxyphenol hydroxylase-like FAD-dependent oxidoreductase